MVEFLTAALPDGGAEEVARRIGIDFAAMQSGAPAVFAGERPADRRNIYREIERVSGDPLACVRAALRFNLEVLGPFYQLLATSKDLGGAIETLTRFQALVHNAALFKLEVVRDVASLEFKMVRPGRFRGEGEFYSLLVSRIGASLCPGVWPTRVELTSSAIAGTEEEMLAAYQCPIDYSQPKVRLLFPAEFLRRPLRASDPEAHGRLCGWADEHQDGVPPNRQSLRLLYDRAVYRSQTTANEVAELARISARQLSETLRTYNTHHREQLDQARKRIAIELVSETDLTVRRIASRLGFSIDYAFARAFRRWTGMTPTDYREAYAAHRRQAGAISGGFAEASAVGGGAQSVG